MKKKPTHTPRRDRKYILLFAISFLVIIVLVLFVKTISQSLFFSSKERINVVLYGKQPIFFSVDMQGQVHYAVEFYPDMKVDVPGGYGQYRIGAVGKLFSLEKKPEVMRQTFAALSSTFVDYYFYPPSPDVYYGERDDEVLIFPNFNQMMQMKSNASFADKMYLSLFFSKAHQLQYKRLRSLRAENFFKQYQGYFYHDTYRKERKNIQIIYRDEYETAELIGRILEGNGIKVNDYTEIDKRLKGCVVYEEESFSDTAYDIASYFNCQLKHGKTGVYDIIFEIGDREEDWEIDD